MPRVLIWSLFFTIDVFLGDFLLLWHKCKLTSLPSSSLIIWSHLHTFLVLLAILFTQPLMLPHWTACHCSQNVFSNISFMALFMLFYSTPNALPRSPEYPSLFPSLLTAWLRHHWTRWTPHMQSIQSEKFWDGYMPVKASPHSKYSSPPSFLVLLCNPFFLPLPTYPPFPDNQWYAYYYRLICIFYIFI